MVVDTSAWIDFFNGHQSREAGRLKQALAEGEHIVLPGIVMTEILLGIRSEAEADRIAGLLEVFAMAPEFDPQDYIEAARLYRLCRAHGQTIRSTVDCLIAQLCIRHDLPLLSKDRDFDLIARHTKLSLVFSS